MTNQQTVSEQQEHDENWSSSIARWAVCYTRSMHGFTKEWAKTAILSNEESNFKWTDNQMKVFLRDWCPIEQNWQKLREWTEACGFTVKWHDNVRLCIEENYAYFRTDDGEVGDTAFVRGCDNDKYMESVSKVLPNEMVSKWFIYTP